MTTTTTTMMKWYWRA